MVRDICRDVLFLSQKAQPASKEDVGIGQDLLDTIKNINVYIKEEESYV